METVKDLNNYPWSGYAVVMGKVKRDWQDYGYNTCLFW